jgi:hypothetical protein
MILTKIKIISNALSLLGLPPINQIDFNDKNHIIALNFYDLVLPDVLSAINWNFAKTVVSLNKLDEDSPFSDYTNVFSLPNNPKFLIIDDLIPRVNYRILNDKLYTDYDGNDLKTVYVTSDINANELPLYFVRYLTTELAKILCFPITGDYQLLQFLMNESLLLSSKTKMVDSRLKQQGQLSKPNDLYDSKF